MSESKRIKTEEPDLKPLKKNDNVPKPLGDTGERFQKRETDTGSSGPKVKPKEESQ